MSDQIYQGPDGTACRFYYEPSKNNFQSEKAGRPIFDNSLMMEVMVPGSRESTPSFEVERTFCAEASGSETERKVRRTEKYAQYAQQIEAFKAQNGEGLVSGTPLAQWPQVDTGTAATLKAAGIHTVEQLAGIQDGHLQNIGMGGRTLRDQARAFMQTRQFGVPSAQMSAEMTHLREHCTRLEGTVRDLTSRLNAAMAELEARRTGMSTTSNVGATDALGLTPAVSQFDPFATRDPASGTPLAPTEGQATDTAKQQFEGQPGGAPQPQFAPDNSQPQHFTPQEGGGGPVPLI